MKNEKLMRMRERGFSVFLMKMRMTRMARITRRKQRMTVLILLRQWGRDLMTTETQRKDD